MTIPIFTLNLNKKILPGRVTIGEYDGKHPCLTAATTADKVFIHNPHQRLGSLFTQDHGGSAVSSGRLDQASHEITLLNVNQRVTALVSGKLDERSERDCLVIGTPTNLLAYDVFDNKDLFYKDVEDGVNAVTIGKLGGENESIMTIIGGNCSLQGFDVNGNDPFWTVTGDNVSSLMLMDHNNNGKNELIVGSDDYEIRIFAEDEILMEITETESVTGLTSLKDGRFGYALANGTVGVYEKSTRWWRIKSKNGASAIFGFDIDGDGVEELITGWSSGKLDARSDRSGEVIFKDNFNHPIAGIMKADYRLDGKMQLVVCGSEGEIRGYSPLSTDGSRQGLLLDKEVEILRDLSSKKQNLLLELKNYEENQRLSMTGKLSARNEILSDGVGVIPAQTQLQTSLLANPQGRPPHVELSLSTTNDTIIKCVLIFAEGIFDGECYVSHFKNPESSVKVPIIPPKDIPVDLHIKAFVGYHNSKNFHVFELTRQLPKFSLYTLLIKDSAEYEALRPSGQVNFKLNERIARVVIWLNHAFLMEEELEPPAPSVTDPFEVKFAFLRKHNWKESNGFKEERADEEDSLKIKGLYFKMTNSGEVNLFCDSMEVAGDFVQSMADFLAIDDLQSVVDFRNELIELQELLLSAEELQLTRQRLSAEMANHSGIVRTLIVRAEDSRLLSDIKNMKKWYSQLYEINHSLISSYKIRCHNHEDLMKTLKEVNQIIQKAARLRVGKTKAKIIADSRTAIKENNIPQLLKVIKYGDPVL